MVTFLGASQELWAQICVQELAGWLFAFSVVAYFGLLVFVPGTWGSEEPHPASQYYHISFPLRIAETELLMGSWHHSTLPAVSASSAFTRHSGWRTVGAGQLVGGPWLNAKG